MGIENVLELTCGTGKAWSPDATSRCASAMVFWRRQGAESCQGIAGVPGYCARRHVAGDTLLHLRLRNLQHCFSFPSIVLVSWSLVSLISPSSTWLHVSHSPLLARTWRLWYRGLLKHRGLLKRRGVLGGSWKPVRFYSRKESCWESLSKQQSQGRFVRVIARCRATAIVPGKTQRWVRLNRMNMPAERWDREDM